MSTAARKARKRAGIPFERTPKVQTTSYVARTDRKNGVTLANQARAAALLSRFGRGLFGGAR